MIAGTAWRLAPWPEPSHILDLEYCRVHCGLADDEIAELIANVRDSGLSRTEASVLFYRTCRNEQPESDLTACEPCVQAILDQALPSLRTNKAESSPGADHAEAWRHAGTAGMAEREQ